MAGDLSPRGWPFLVARGRRLGYRTLMAPGFLIDERDHGILDDRVVPGSSPEVASVIELVTGAGRRLTVVHATHPVTAADITGPGTPSGAGPRPSGGGGSAEAGSGTPAGAGPGAPVPRDEHSRPLRLIYGFCVDGTVSRPDEDDLRACREVALGAYRRFLGDEEGFTVEPGPEFRPVSPVVPPTQGRPSGTEDRRAVTAAHHESGQSAAGGRDLAGRRERAEVGRERAEVGGRERVEAGGREGAGGGRRVMSLADRRALRPPAGRGAVLAGTAAVLVVAMIAVVFWLTRPAPPAPPVACDKAGRVSTSEPGGPAGDERSGGAGREGEPGSDGSEGSDGVEREDGPGSDASSRSPVPGTTPACSPTRRATTGEGDRRGPR
ncbi:hypothetical protein [Sphaerisporangium corydalis]|uniref:Uncharacterized protein n=1 Tax=Sphaerisporangium corydalis TaxID=1441875 RepID=A0ABV9EQA5_9ACTN|nr:hypothetical protein [Sphaerisporangium corydalis]